MNVPGIRISLMVTSLAISLWAMGGETIGASGASAGSVPRAAGLRAVDVTLANPLKAEFVEAALVEMASELKQILKMVEDARRERDIIRLNCLNDKVVVYRSLLKVAQEAKDGLKLGMDAENADLVIQEFRRAAVSREQGVHVRAEADACLGDVGSSTEGSGRDWSLQSHDEDGEVSEDYGADPSGYTRPPEATPFN